MKKIKVGLLYGGRSVEHNVSVHSAYNIEKHINKKIFKTFPIGISKNGIWTLTPTVQKDIETGKKIQLSLNSKKPFFTDNSGKIFQIDVVFSVLHGTDGEDGSIQGLFKTVGIPIVGTDVMGSAIAMNKMISKQLMIQAGLPTAAFMHYSYKEKNKIQFRKIKSKIGLPFMVKAVHLGSSVGVSKVNKKADFIDAVEDSFQYDNDILFEEYISGREIECALLGNTPPQASLPGEIIIHKHHDFYNFNAKYVDSKAVSIKIPAKLNKTDKNKIRALCLRTFRVLQCQDFARIDLFLSKKNKIYINEVNTLPGFTNSSMFPLMWKERGISFTDVITQLIQLSLNRFKESKRIKKDFLSSLKI